ncbi:hypothetical protein D3C72_1563740 [compost metagenome]
MASPTRSGSLGVGGGVGALGAAAGADGELEEASEDAAEDAAEDAPEAAVAGCAKSRYSSGDNVGSTRMKATTSQICSSVSRYCQAGMPVILTPWRVIQNISAAGRSRALPTRDAGAGFRPSA